MCALNTCSSRVFWNQHCTANLHNVPQFFKNTGEEYVHVLTQATVLEENQKTYVHN